MREQNSYSSSAALTVATPNPELVGELTVAALLVTATVAGNLTLTLASGSSVTAAVGVGTTIFPLAVINVSASTATATYWQLA